MLTAGIIFLGVLVFLFGYGAGVFVVSRDPDLIRLKDNELIVVKPVDGLILAAVPPHLVRKFITHPDDYPTTEARSHRNVK